MAEGVASKLSSDGCRGDPHIAWKHGGGLRKRGSNVYWARPWSRHGAQCFICTSSLSLPPWRRLSEWGSDQQQQPVLGPHPRPAKSETLRAGTRNLKSLFKSFKCFDALKLEKYCPRAVLPPPGCMLQLSGELFVFVLHGGKAHLEILI